MGSLLTGVPLAETRSRFSELPPVLFCPRLRRCRLRRMFPASILRTRWLSYGLVMVWIHDTKSPEIKKTPAPKNIRAGVGKIPVRIFCWVGLSGPTPTSRDFLAEAPLASLPGCWPCIAAGRSRCRGEINTPGRWVNGISVFGLS